MYANDGLLTRIINRLTALRFNYKKKYTTFIKSKMRLRKGLTKSGGLLGSKNNGLTKLSNGPYGVVTSLLVLA